GASLKVTRISFGSLPAASSGTYGASSFARILIEIDGSGGAPPTVRSADFGLNDRQRHPRPAATGFSPCQAWTEIDAPRSGSTIPAVCFAVNDTEITHYKLTWARLQPGQTISLYMPS
ncbi:MAG TPA: hypothetical protein VGR61_02780, partial [Candidatus Dormibacteraeota bacterium]|nr:hypothetical protein [Candidatus Dormibacteraeota bacterium]